MAAKPFSVFADNTGRVHRFTTFDAAEAFAKRAHARGCRHLSIEHEGEQIAQVRLDWRDVVVVDLNHAGAALVPLS